MCLNLPFELKTNWHFTKWDSLNILFVIQYIRCFKNFWGSANIILQTPPKMGKSAEDFESSIFFEAQKYYFAFESTLIFFSNGYIPNIVKIDVENNNVVSMLLNVVNYNVDVHNVVSTMIWRCATWQRHINLKTTLNRRWNVCWVFWKTSQNSQINTRTSHPEVFCLKKRCS